MCKARRMNDQMMCECGLAWDIDDEAPECPRSRVVKCDGYSTDEGRVCVTCGGTMIGDGYTVVVHCENVDTVGEGYEPDANPVHCLIDEGDRK